MGSIFSTAGAARSDADADTDDNYLPPIKIETSWDHNALKRQLDETAARTVVECGYPEEYFWADVKLAIMFAACVVAVVAQFFPGEFPKNYHVLLVCVYCYVALSVLLQVVFSVVDRDFIIFTRHRPSDAAACADCRCPCQRILNAAAQQADRGGAPGKKKLKAAVKRAAARCETARAPADSLLCRYGVEVRTAMAPGQLEYTLELALRHAPSGDARCATSHTTRANLFFDEAGYFDEDLFCKEVELALGKFEEAVARQDVAAGKKTQ